MKWVSYNLNFSEWDLFFPGIQETLKEDKKS